MQKHMQNSLQLDLEWINNHSKHISPNNHNLNFPIRNQRKNVPLLVIFVIRLRIFATRILILERIQ